MSGSGEVQSQEDAEQLAAQLEAIRRLNEADLREAFRRTVRDAVGRWPPDRARQVLAALLRRFSDEPAPVETPGISPTAQDLVYLRAQLDAIGLERDRLRKEVEQLRAAPHAAAAPTPAEPPVAAATSPPPPPPPTGLDAGEEKLERIRQALIRLTQNKEVDLESLGLAEQQARLFRLMRELLRFALTCRLGVSLLLTEFKVGDTAEMDTQMMQGFRQLVRDRFRDCLEQGEGAVRGLKEILDRNARFVVDLNSAYVSCISSGIERILEDLDPAAILDEHKRMVGYNYEKAWKDLSRRLGDLSDQSREDLWERYYFESFRSRLSHYLDQG